MSLSAKTRKWLDKNGPGSLEGKTVLVTGANSGVGFKTAEIAVYLKASLIMACRSRERAQSARETLLNDYPDAKISIMTLDLSDLSSVCDFAKKIAEQGTDIDVFVNNAGVFRHPGQKTKDGFDLVLGTNYFGVYKLTELLMPYLLTLPHRVVYINTISIAHKIGRISYGDFYGEKKYGDLAVYARSKLCLAKYSYALAKRYEDGNVKVLMNHPGIALTPLGLNAFGNGVRKLSRVFGWMFNSPEKSSLSVAYILSKDMPAGSVTGPRKLFGGWGYPKPNRVGRKVKEGAEELIGFTEKELRGHLNDA